eukprot:8514449-Prorocentrum_lima.AAC.1
MTAGAATPLETLQATIRESSDISFGRLAAAVGALSRARCGFMGGGNGGGGGHGGGGSSC